jgi:hypothetical protein
MRHLLLHAAGNIRARALRLIQLHDLALVGRALGADGWSELLDGPGGARDMWWAYAPLLMTRYYFPSSVPDAVMEQATRTCPPWLRRSCLRRRLSDVSWSNPRIQALPGIEWSRTFGEAIRFAASRVWPRRADLDELRVAAAASSYGSMAGWYRQSHVLRIARWLFAAPGRPQTMYTVQRALERDAA